MNVSNIQPSSSAKASLTTNTTGVRHVPQNKGHVESSHLNSVLDYHIDPSDPNLQQNTLTYLNKMLKHHGSSLQAELSELNGQTYIAVSDKNTGDLIRRVKMEEAIRHLMGGREFLIDQSA